MKKLLFISFLGISLAACKTSTVERTGLVGKWKLTEVLADPGDGSGTWRAADPAHPDYLEFRSDSTLSPPTGAINFLPYVRRYHVTSDTTLFFINGRDSIGIRYRLSGNSLTILPPCYEACGLRYSAIR